ncbi:ammonia-forming cytochrome c nitrite reductase subunit c552 [Bacteriovorax sp. Seq25_V]|uniref:ammonia-forming cytochrome c nitrite reductase subunit c552 n=1 Tax=Bacteriovorax sp. Seq25_V TaxID=1201288 RepID=UPI00038A1F14|nr:ammonia-forming cytochrome c nitrite reductase subunit c552 [Bacteriovorax sp. Seq25_V]EQC47449.1 nitrite reductase, cytochrome c552, ammonia-forming [Bacteriovorax sp. Seq25_V]
MKNFTKRRVLLALISIFVTTSCILLVLNILERKTEGKFQTVHLKDIGELEDDPAVWGVNFPYQYEDYLKNVDQVRTRYGGSEAVKRVSDSSDPREIVSEDKLKIDERFVTMWSGYAFSKDFREERGHAFMLIDQLYTKRQNVGQPGTCINCHASTYSAMMKLGDGDINKGFHALNKLPYFEAAKNVKHPVSCIDCHNPKDMSLRVTRPAFVEGIREFKKSVGVHEYDVNKMASRQEMKTFVCAQCHVEYYFKGKDKTLTYPWGKGLKGDEILSYYNEIDFKDWTHNLTKSAVLKAQHPEFETYSQGIHARSGVSCVDCHMPYKKVGAMKITDHHINSPMLKVNQSCRTCHNISEDKLLERVAVIQDNNHEMKDTVFNALVSFIKKIEANSNHPKIEELRKAQRDAQFLFDFVEAENSNGFHAPQESARILLKSLDIIRKGEELL